MPTNPLFKGYDSMAFGIFTRPRDALPILFNLSINPERNPRSRFPPLPAAPGSRSLTSSGRLALKLLPRMWPLAPGCAHPLTFFLLLSAGCFCFTSVPVCIGSSFLFGMAMPRRGPSPSSNACH